MLEMPDRRCGSLFANFTVAFPKTKHTCDEVTTQVERLLRRFHFINTKNKNIEADVAESVFVKAFKHYDLQENSVSDRDPQCRSEFLSRTMVQSPVQMTI